MAKFKRYAIYDAPRAGAYADRVASWLGWDAATGSSVPFSGPDVLPAAQEDLTRSPRKYGFHGTLKPPFRLAVGVTQGDLSARLAAVAHSLTQITCPGLHLQDRDGFLALVPTGNHSGVSALADQVVRRFDDLRAPLTKAEIARRDPARLTPRQRQLLMEWGYPYVLDQFQFHLTLTNMLPKAQSSALAGPLADWLAPVLPQPFHISDLCLFAEDTEGRFHLLERHPLGRQ